MARPHPLTRGDYRWFSPIETRWVDNDVYGHVNNAVYYAFIDSAVNRFMIDVGQLDIHQGRRIAFVVESGCTYHAPATYPDPLEVGIRVAHLGTSSIRWEAGIFNRVPDPEPADPSLADARFVHVFVDRETRRPVSIPDGVRQALIRLATSRSAQR